MTYNNTLNNDNILPMSEKAVRGYVKNHFKGFFCEEDIEDMVSEVALRIYRAKESFNTDKAVFPWVWTIAKNVVKDAAAAKSKYEAVTESLDDALNDIVGTMGVDWKLRQKDMLDGFLSKLTQERDKRLLRDLVDELDAKEIAEKEGMTVRQVYMAVFHLRCRLKKSA